MKRNTKIGTSILLIFVATALSWGQMPAAYSLVRLGGISAENGEFAIQDGLITAYTDQEISVEFGPNAQRQFLESHGFASFEVEGGNLRRVQKDVPLAFAHEFQFCDSLDQVDLSNGSKTIVSALPKKAKIKSMEDLADGRTLIFYTVPDDSNEGPNIGYKIMVSILKANSSHGYSIVDSNKVTSYGEFCGTQALTKDLRAILVDELAGSSNFNVVYIYAIKVTPQSSTKQQ